jgi:glycosyltransferase involved in cell wall biosynthesis
MRILFIHQNLPGQYKHLLKDYASDPTVEVVGVGEGRRLRENFARPTPGLRLLAYAMPVLTDISVPEDLRSTDAAVRRGRAVLEVLLRLKKEGFYPDTVCAHPGWGETMFIRDVFPRARLIHYCEFYYRSSGQDFGFDPEFPPTASDMLRLRTRNMHHLMAVEQADVGVAPTSWQRDRFPEAFRGKIKVVHDGVNTQVVKPDEHAFLRFPTHGFDLTSRDEVITFVSRNLEPYRGFHTFMRALPAMLLRRPHARVIIVGGDEVSYGRRLSEGTYRQRYLDEVKGSVDISRIHFVGKVPYDLFLKILQVSSVHVYLTYPFVLSWSLMEAMAAGCLIVGSRTAPVEEVISHGENGFLTDFFSPSALADTVCEALAERQGLQQVRDRARLTIVDRYDLVDKCLPVQRGIIEQRCEVSPADGLSLGTKRDHG